MNTNNKFLIVGKTATGKTTLMDMLEKEGLLTRKSYTTAKPKNNKDESHIFIDDEEFHKFDGQRCLETTHSNKHYFYHTKQLEDFDFLILDPQGVKDIIELKPEYSFIVIILNASEQNARSAFLNRLPDILTDEQKEEMYLTRVQSEKQMFDSFQEYLNMEVSKEMNIRVQAYYIVDNDYEPQTLQDVATMIVRTKNLLTNIEQLLPIAVKEKLFEVEEKGNIMLKHGDVINYVKPHDFAFSLLSDEVNFGRLCLNTLALVKKLKI